MLIQTVLKSKYDSFCIIHAALYAVCNNNLTNNNNYYNNNYNNNNMEMLYKINSQHQSKNNNNNNTRKIEFEICEKRKKKKMKNETASPAWNHPVLFDSSVILLSYCTSFTAS